MALKFNPFTGTLDYTVTSLEALKGKLSELTSRKHHELEAFDEADDHKQYARLEGRAGGQELRGDTAASGKLTLSSTTNATKGEILIGESSAFIDKVIASEGKGDELGLGTKAPAGLLEVKPREPSPKATEGSGAGARAIFRGIGAKGQEVAGKSAGVNSGGTGSEFRAEVGQGADAENTEGAATAGNAGSVLIGGAPGGRGKGPTGQVVTGGIGAAVTVTAGAGGKAFPVAAGKPSSCTGGDAGAFAFTGAEGGTAEKGEVTKGGAGTGLTFEAGKGASGTGAAGFTKEAIGGNAGTIKFNANAGGSATGTSEKAIPGTGGSIEFTASAGGTAIGGTVENRQAKGGSLIFKAGASGTITTKVGEVSSTGGEISLTAGEGKSGFAGGPIKFKTFKENAVVANEFEVTTNLGLPLSASVDSPWEIPTGKTYVIPELIQGLFKESISVQGTLNLQGRLDEVGTPEQFGTAQLEAEAVTYPKMASFNFGIPVEVPSGKTYEIPAIISALWRDNISVQGVMNVQGRLTEV